MVLPASPPHTRSNPILPSALQPTSLSLFMKDRPILPSGVGGSFDGAAVGRADGAAVAARVGISDGVDVGVWVGEAVGDGVWW